MRCQTCPPFSPPQIPDTDAASPHERHDRSRSPPFPKKVRPGTRSSTVHSTVPDFTEDRLRFFLRPPFESFDIPEPIPSGRRSGGPCPRSVPCDPAAGEQRQIRPRPAAKECSPSKNYRPVPTRLAERSARHSALRTGRTAFVHFPPRYASAPAQLPRLTVRTKGVRMKRIRKKPSAIHSQTAFS